VNLNLKHVFLLRQTEASWFRSQQLLIFDITN